MVARVLAIGDSTVLQELHLIYSDDHLYVADHNNHRVQKFTIDGKYLLHFRGEGSEKLSHPSGLVVHNHKVYVVDCGKGQISVFQSDGKFLHTFGWSKSLHVHTSLLGAPYDVTVNDNNQLLVADYGGTYICTFTLDGDYVKSRSTVTGRGGLLRPFSVAVDLYGFILVADACNDYVAISDKYGNLVHCFGSEGAAVGQFKYPHGIAVSANGDIYVSDHDNKRIQIFSCSILV